MIPVMDSARRPITVVTGGSRGIGAATVLHLARNGHDVAVNYRQDEEAAERIVQMAAAAGARAVSVRADVTSEDDVERLFDAAQQKLGPVSGLVNNAGVTIHFGDLAETPVDVLREVLEVDLVGVILCARRAAQMMSTRRGGMGGAIVNVSSAAATLGSAHEYVHYAAAKAGVDALTIGLGKELAEDGIRVNAVAPGIVRTDIHAAAGDADRPDRMAARIPLGRPGEPAEIATAIGWLLSPEASYVTGAILRIAGGL
ncbi:MAG TPA: SDR family oxidoreductase [Candidatus Dormibacteraeota bacterium]|jgi:glucose 1-dehydrogenase|nr:SDR family oxidoreductase [Candidatus Dormibacteraeota bacterium]